MSKIPEDVESLARRLAASYGISVDDAVSRAIKESAQAAGLLAEGQANSPSRLLHTACVAVSEQEHVQVSLTDRIQRALLLLAYFIELDGDVHLAMYEQFEKELYALRQRETTKDRARQLLASYSQSGDLKAIFPEK